MDLSPLKLSPVRLAPDPLGDFSPAVAELSPLKLSPAKLSPLKLSPVKPSPHHEHDKRITGPKVLPETPESQSQVMQTFPTDNQKLKSHNIWVLTDPCVKN